MLSPNKSEMSPVTTPLKGRVGKGKLCYDLTMTNLRGTLTVNAMNLIQYINIYIINQSTRKGLQCEMDLLIISIAQSIHGTLSKRMD